MSTIRTAAARMRLPWVAVLAILLTLRVIGGAGYMPMVEQGRLTLMLCPDGEWTAPSSAMDGRMDHKGPQSTHHHQLCPYAAAAALHVSSGDLPSLIPLRPVAFLVPGVAPARLVERAVYRRPPSTGPPIRA